MRLWLLFISLLLLGVSPALISAGPYAPPADEEGTTAVYKDDTAFGSWASDYENYVAGEEVNAEWQTPNKALGMAVGTISDICCLGRGGEITLTFDNPIQNRDGWDFAVFENGVTDTFLELAFVEVSSNGTDFVRFNNDSLTANPIPAFGSLDTTNIDGVAGKYKIGYGTPFDFEDLPDKVTVNIDAVTHIRIVDVVGDGSFFDTSGDVIYDPYPTENSAGFDLDAVGVLISDPTIPWVFETVSGIAAGECFIATAAYGSPMEPKVQILRNFRDMYLLRSNIGRAFVKTYYRVSPKAAGFIAESRALRYMVRITLLPFIGTSYLVLNISAVQKWMILSLCVMSLISSLIIVRNLLKGRIKR